jgi:glycosyltransferase involved in cell wall biosynthesis
VLLRSIARRARVVATVSRFSADELMRHLGVPAARLEIIGEGGEHILRTPADRSILDRLGLDGRPYVLAVGSQSPNKNLRAVVEAMALLGDRRIPLVAAGGSNARIFAGTDGADQQVLRTGYISDAELRALYESATCFVFPSFYEGFGLPPLEAMCCDCPVIVADRSSLPEVCADAALYCNPDDPASLAAELRRLLDSAALRDELRQAGRRRVAHFGWQRAGAQFVDVVRGRFEVDLPMWRSGVVA